MKQLSITDSQRTIGDAIIAHIPCIYAQFRKAIAYVENADNCIGTHVFYFSMVAAPLINTRNSSGKKLQQAFALLFKNVDVLLMNKFVADEKTLTFHLEINNFQFSRYDLLMLESYVKTFHTMVYGAVIQRKGWSNII